MFNLFTKAAGAKGVARIAPQQAKDMVKNGAAELIDVRTVDEYRQARIPQSRNIPLSVLAFTAEQSIPDKKRPVIVYCLSGGRSAQACSLLANMGYESVYDLGGINAWPYEIAR